VNALQQSQKTFCLILTTTYISVSIPTECTGGEKEKKT
jgi:hypothetical protein